MNHLPPFTTILTMAQRNPLFNILLKLALVVLSSPSNSQEPVRTPLVVISQQGPNISSWVLAPLDQSIPDAIRPNVTFLREDLIDEGKTKPVASLDAYRVGHQFCNDLITALDERDKMLLKAGYRAVQTGTTTPATNQTLDARRNYMMSWPQYHREVEQRTDHLRVVEANDRRRVELVLQDLKIQWARRVTGLQTKLDDVYAKLREEMRKSGVAVNSFTGVVSPGTTTSTVMTQQPEAGTKSKSSDGFDDCNLYFLTKGQIRVFLDGESVPFQDISTNDVYTFAVCKNVKIREGQLLVIETVSVFSYRGTKASIRRNRDNKEFPLHLAKWRRIAKDKPKDITVEDIKNSNAVLPIPGGHDVNGPALWASQGLLSEGDGGCTAFQSPERDKPFLWAMEITSALLQP